MIVAVQLKEEIWVPLGGGKCRVCRNLELTCFIIFSVEAFEDASFALAPGQISEPVDTDSGIHLIYKLE